MTAWEEIKKAIEGVGQLKVEFTPDSDECNSIIAPINDDYDGTFFTVIGCGDKQDKLGAFMAMAVNELPELVATIESWGREKAFLRVRVFDLRAGYHEAIARAEAAEAEVKRLRQALKPFAEYMGDSLDKDNHGDPVPYHDGVGWIYLTHGDFRRARQALASTGGEHHGN